MHLTNDYRHFASCCTRYRHPRLDMVDIFSLSCPSQSTSTSVCLSAYTHPRTRSKRLSGEPLPFSTRCSELTGSGRKTSVYYICSGCQSFYEQPLVRMTQNVHEPSGNVNNHFKAHTGPTVPSKCPECNSTLHVCTLLLSFFDRS